VIYTTASTSSSTKSAAAPVTSSAQSQSAQFAAGTGSADTASSQTQTEAVNSSIVQSQSEDNATATAQTQATGSVLGVSTSRPDYEKEYQQVLGRLNDLSAQQTSNQSLFASLQLEFITLALVLSCLAVYEQFSRPKISKRNRRNPRKLILKQILKSRVLKRIFWVRVLKRVTEKIRG
jgi:hypothetical protein